MAGRAEYDLAMLPRRAWHSGTHRAVPHAVQTQAPTKIELQLAIRDELVSRMAELYGRRPEEIDPDFGL